MAVLRTYQVELLGKLRESVRTGSKSTLAVLPCGGGKTKLFGEIVRSHLRLMGGNALILVLVHRKELMRQTAEVFASEGLGEELGADGRIRIMSPVRACRLSDEVKPSLIIVDEAHHATSSSYRGVFLKYSQVLRLGFTATPCRLDGAPLGDVWETMAEGVTSKWLVSRGYLTRYKYFAPKLELGHIRTRSGDYDQTEVARKLMRPTIWGDIFKYLDPEKRTIIYAPSLEFSRNLVDEINKRFGDGIARHIDGDTDKAERVEAVESFRRGDCRMLSNVDLIGEGFDVPACDCVVMLRPTKSLSLFIQQSGRALRTDPQHPEKVATIYDLVGNCYRHGLPDDIHEWSLTGKVKSPNPNATSEDNGDADLTVRTCVDCLRTAESKEFRNGICPYCGTIQPRTAKEIKQEKEAELEQITALKKHEEKNEQARARTYTDLVELAKKRGYKNPNGWAYWIIQSRTKKKFY